MIALWWRHHKKIPQLLNYGCYWDIWHRATGEKEPIMVLLVLTALWRTIFILEKNECVTLCDAGNVELMVQHINHCSRCCSSETSGEGVFCRRFWITSLMLQRARPPALRENCDIRPENSAARSTPKYYASHYGTLNDKHQP